MLALWDLVWQRKGMNTYLTEKDFLGHLECLLIEQANIVCRRKDTALLVGFNCHEAVDAWQGGHISMIHSPLHNTRTQEGWPMQPVDVCVLACANLMAIKEPRWLDRIHDILNPGGVLVFHAWGGDSIVSWPGLSKPRWAVEDMVSVLSKGQWGQPQVMVHQVDWDIDCELAARRELETAGYTKEMTESLSHLSWPQSWSCQVMYGFAERKPLSVVDVSQVNVRS